MIYRLENLKLQFQFATLAVFLGLAGCAFLEPTGKLGRATEKLEEAMVAHVAHCEQEAYGVVDACKSAEEDNCGDIGVAAFDACIAPVLVFADRVHAGASVIKDLYGKD